MNRIGYSLCGDHTCIRINCSVYPQLPPVIGAPWGCCGHASGIYFPRSLWFGGCATHATPCSVPGYSYFRMCLENSERNCPYKLLVQCSNPLSPCVKRCFRLSLSTRNKKNERNQQKTRLEASKPPTVFTTALNVIKRLYFVILVYETTILYT